MNTVGDKNGDKNGAIMSEVCNSRATNLCASVYKNASSIKHNKGHGPGVGWQVISHLQQHSTAHNTVNHGGFRQDDRNCTAKRL